MQITINEQGYITNYAILGNIVGGIEVPTPEDLSHFEEYFQSYSYEDGNLSFNEGYSFIIAAEFKKEELRQQREVDCFPIINRGKLWYDGLTEEQLSELGMWYQAWLDVTETLEIPVRPTWLV